MCDIDLENYARQRRWLGVKNARRYEKLPLTSLTYHTLHSQSVSDCIKELLRSETFHSKSIFSEDNGTHNQARIFHHRFQL